MKITNKHGLPEPLVRAITNDNYSKGDADYSVTELVKPPRIAALERLHWNELEEDASDRLWLLMGKAGHEVLRKSSDGGIVEERCTVEVDGFKISGQVDYAVADKALFDYKFTSLWAVKEGVKIEWEQQENAYAWLCRQYGVEVRELKIIAILRDWSKSKASYDNSYPQSQVAVLPVRMWPDEEIRNWIRGRIRLHESARAGKLPECLPDEMWETAAQIAVKKKGAQRATKLFDSPDEALKDLAARGSGYEIERRPSERPRCQSYCSVADRCVQYLAWKESHNA